jgi:hypothetical protein
VIRDSGSAGGNRLWFARLLDGSPGGAGKLHPVMNNPEDLDDPIVRNTIDHDVTGRWTRRAGSMLVRTRRTG